MNEDTGIRAIPLILVLLAAMLTAAFWAGMLVGRSMERAAKYSFQGMRNRIRPNRAQGTGRVETRQ